MDADILLKRYAVQHTNTRLGLLKSGKSQEFVLLIISYISRE
jgi:hypothetical protein